MPVCTSRRVWFKFQLTTHRLRVVPVIQYRVRGRTVCVVSSVVETSVPNPILRLPAFFFIKALLCHLRIFQRTVLSVQHGPLDPHIL